MLHLFSPLWITTTQIQIFRQTLTNDVRVLILCPSYLITTYFTYAFRFIFWKYGINKIASSSFMSIVNCFAMQSSIITDYSLMNMRQLHISFRTWRVIVCCFLCFPPNLPKLNLKLFCSYVQNNFRFSSGKFRGKHRNQQTITCQVLAELNKIWSFCTYGLHCL